MAKATKQLKIQDDVVETEEVVSAEGEAAPAKAPGKVVMLKLPEELYASLNRAALKYALDNNGNVHGFMKRFLVDAIKSAIEAQES